MLPEHRSFHAACLVKNDMIVVGGRGLENQHFDDIHTFNLGDECLPSLVFYTVVTFYCFGHIMEERNSQKGDQI